MGEFVNTVNGEIPVESLGKTLMHEHFVFGYPGYLGDTSWDHISRREILEHSVEIAKGLISNGFKTLLDATPNDCGRDVELLKEVSQETGLQIMCSTGYYFEELGARSYWKIRSMFHDTVKEITELMVRELTVGINGSGIKASVIKLASSPGEITPYEKSLFIAGAKAQQETGAVITTHTADGTMGLEQASLLVENGAEPTKIIIGHMCGKLDVDYHEKIMDMGISVGFDRIGQEYFGYPSDSERLALLKELIQRGRVGSIVMSHDVLGTILGRPISLTENMLKNFHVRYIPETFIPMMKEAGITDEQVNQIFVENPKRIFS